VPAALDPVRGRCGRLHPETPMNKYTGRPLTRWTHNRGGEAVNYAKPG
jgi:hypothetical protein